MMQVPVEKFRSDATLQQEAAALLRDRDGLVCFPCSGAYRLGASLLSGEGVMALLQAKRRSGHRPALVMVASADMLPQVVESIPETARRMIDAVWPGDVTLRLPLSRSLDRRVYRDLSRPDGKVGVRLPLDPVAELLVRAAGVPVLVSSANRSKKAGSGSIALIRKQFAPSLSMLIDAGDLPPRPPSTIVEFDEPDGFRLVRKGAVSEEEIRMAMERAEP